MERRLTYLHDNLQDSLFTIAAINTFMEARVMLLRHIRNVLAVAERRNFTRAAEALHLLVAGVDAPSRSGSLKKPSPVIRSQWPPHPPDGSGASVGVPV